jgi:hypothetical protein
VPVLFFDALAEEQADAGLGRTSAAPHRPGTPMDGAIVASPPVRHRRATMRPTDVDQWLRRAVAVVSAAIVVVVAALVGSVLTVNGAPPVLSGLQGASVRTTQPSSTLPVAPSTTTTSAPAAVPVTPNISGTTTTLPPPSQLSAPAGAPVLTSLQPSSGTAGQSVVVSGSGFLSPSGHIWATVGGQTASVSCPDQTTCTLTIPSQAVLATAAPVVIVTDSGSSNLLNFTLT